ncbi:hypothetical protein ACLKA6_015998 [Drosophila palustris]
MQRRSNLQKRSDNGEMAGEMESYYKRQLDETYRPGHTAVDNLDPDLQQGQSLNLQQLQLLFFHNNFGCAQWVSIVRALQQLSISEFIVSFICSYFRDRVLLFDTSSDCSTGSAGASLKILNTKSNIDLEQR